MSYWKILFIGFCLACQSFACQPSTPIQPPVIDSTPQPLWSQARDRGAGVYGWFPHFMHNNQYITYTKKNGRAFIVALNKDTGQEIWAWSDLFTLEEEAKTNQVHIYDNILVWRSVRRVYAINLVTGQTVWRQNIRHYPS
jgi:outer membrane protein assembly factor BamB